MTRESVPNAVADCMLRGCQKGELRAEVERLQGHMRALADTSVARDTAGIFKGLWQGSEQECEELRAEVERLKAAEDHDLRTKRAYRTEIERLKAENAEQKAEMQKLYDNWVRVLKLPEEPKP